LLARYITSLIELQNIDKELQEIGKEIENFNLMCITSEIASREGNTYPLS
jgi:hypothetical protein